MKKTLKQQNCPQVVVFLLANVFGIGTALLGWPLVAVLFTDMLNGNLASIGKLVVVPALGALILGVVSWLLPVSIKETLVFWGVGPRRLPSSRAFTVIAPRDPRIDIARLATRIGALPTDTDRQNVVWYGIYRKHGKEPPVLDANAAYLLYREMVALMPFLGCATALLALVIPFRTSHLLAVGAVLLVEYMILVLAARNAGSRLVANVLAIEATASESVTGAVVSRSRSVRTPKAK